jgi:hypothetical protein
MVLKERLAQPERSSEAMINEVEAKRAHLKIGSHPVVRLFLKQTLSAGNGGFGRTLRPDGLRFRSARRRHRARAVRHRGRAGEPGRRI